MIYKISPRPSLLKRGREKAEMTHSVTRRAVFNKQVVTEKGMAEPDYAYHKKRNQYLSTAILNALMEQKEYAAYGAPRASP